MSRREEAEIDVVSGTASWACSLSPGIPAAVHTVAAPGPVELRVVEAGVDVSGRSALGCDSIDVPALIHRLAEGGSRYLQLDRISGSQAD